MNNEIFSLPQAAKRCAISRWTLRKHVKSGELRSSLTPGGHYRILKEDLESFVVKMGMYPLAYKRFSTKRILIVDNDPHIQELFAEMLSAHQYETEVASDGFAAGAKVMEFKPDLIVLDLFMPGMDGFEVCMRIKENSGTSQIKILAITGYDTKENRDRIMAAGADAYAAKPLDMNTLLQNVENLLNDNRAKGLRPDRTPASGASARQGVLE